MTTTLKWTIDNYLNTKIRGELYRRVDRSGGPDACWPWLGPTDKANRGVMSFPDSTTTKGRKRRAYQIAWELYRWRLLEPGEQVNHRCDNPICVNPFHLYQGSQQHNIQESLRNRRLNRRNENGTTV